MRIARRDTVLPRAVGSEDRRNLVVFFDFRQPKGSVAASGSGGQVNIRAGVDQGADGGGLILVNGMHERRPIVDPAALVDVGSGPDQLADRSGVAIAGGGDERRNGRSRITGGGK